MLVNNNKDIIGELLEFSYRERGLYYFIGYKKSVEDYNKFYGEVYVINFNKEIIGKGFVFGSLLFGVVNRYRDGNNYKEFYSLHEPGKKISEGEYRKELANIRFGIKEEPECLKWYSKTLPVNCLELFNNKFEENKRRGTITIKLGGKK